ncbi:hypothetical protein CR513_44058, partial [Mucuna pruriens]
MTWTLKNLCELQEVPACLVGLLNGQHLENNSGLLNKACEGPYKILSSCGALYFSTIKEVSCTLMNFCAMVERQYDQRVKIVRSDNATKFTCMKNYFLECDIEGVSLVVVLEVKESLVGELHARVNVGIGRDDIVRANVVLTVRTSANASA